MEGFDRGGSIGKKPQMEGFNGLEENSSGAVIYLFFSVPFTAWICGDGN